jgi:hypothetical protein
MGALKEFGRLFGFGLSEAEKERRERLRALRQETRREEHMLKLKPDRRLASPEFSAGHRALL